MRKQAIAALLREHYQAELSEVRDLIDAASADLHYGDTSSDGYPGFEAACKQIRAALDSARDVWIDTNSEIVLTREPDMCDGCDDEDCHGMPSEDVLYVDGPTVRRHLLGELAGYV